MGGLKKETQDILHKLVFFLNCCKWTFFSNLMPKSLRSTLTSPDKTRVNSRNFLFVLSYYYSHRYTWIHFAVVFPHDFTYQCKGRTIHDLWIIIHLWACNLYDYISWFTIYVLSYICWVSELLKSLHMTSHIPVMYAFYRNTYQYMYMILGVYDWLIY
jgi:hypothetical protein